MSYGAYDYQPSQSSPISVTVSSGPPTDIPTAFSNWTALDPTSGIAPLTVRFQAKLVNTQTQAGISGKTIQILVNNAQVATQVTDSSGIFSVSLSFPSAGSYSIIAKFAGG